MEPMTRRTALCFLALLTAGSGHSESDSTGQGAGVPREEVSEETPAGPLSVFARVEEAWRSDDARALTELLDPEDKIGLSFSKGGPRGGWFNRDQAYFLLKDLLEFSRTERFEFETYWNVESNVRSPYAVAVHEFRMNDGATHTDQVYLSLRLRGETWYVGEIRSIDR